MFALSVDLYASFWAAELEAVGIPVNCTVKCSPIALRTVPSVCLLADEFEIQESEAVIHNKKYASPSHRLCGPHGREQIEVIYPINRLGFVASSFYSCFLDHVL